MLKSFSRQEALAAQQRLDRDFRLGRQHGLLFARMDHLCGKSVAVEDGARRLYFGNVLAALGRSSDRHPFHVSRLPLESFR